MLSIQWDPVSRRQDPGKAEMGSADRSLGGRILVAARLRLPPHVLLAQSKNRRLASTQPRDVVLHSHMPDLRIVADGLKLEP